jgi:hypothetical protein
MVASMLGDAMVILALKRDLSRFKALQQPFLRSINVSLPSVIRQGGVAPEGIWRDR